MFNRILQNMVNRYLSRVLGTGGWKTIAGIGLGVVVNVARWFDVVPAEIDGQWMDMVYTALTGLGLGHKLPKDTRTEAR